MNLPSGKAPATRPKEKPKVNYVDVDPEGGLKLNNQDVVLKELPQLFKVLKESEAEPSVVVRGADEVNYQHVISVIDLLQQADINKVGLATAAPR
jgi:biopolymer transport protein ExbD